MPKPSDVSAEVLQTMSEVLSRMVEENNTKEGLHTKTPASSMTAQRLHGFNGTFASPGLERDVVTAHIRPTSFSSQLPLLPSVIENPQFAALTGVGEYAGSEPTNVCDDAPSGYIKGGILTARFGFVRRDTDTIDMSEVMLKVNRSDFTDLVLRGRLLGLTNLAPGNLNEQDVLDIVTMSEMVTTGVMAERKLAKMLWQGSYLIPGEFPGLDVQIATGQVDADSNVALPSLDSDVKNYGYAAIGSSLVEYISTLEWYIRNNAMKMGLEPATWKFVMRPDLWQELTAIWPIAYNTNRGSSITGQNSTIFLNGRENVDDRDAMRNGMYIDINGRRYDVVVDDGIYEKNSTNTAGLIPGQYASSIYMVPMTIAGGMPVTYREYLDFRKAQPDVSLLHGTEQFFWTDNGVYTWATEFVKWCYKISLLTKQRVVLRTPHLAGRIDNIKYEPLQHLRDFDPASPYFADGGVSVRSMAQKPYAIWSDR